MSNNNWQPNILFNSEFIKDIEKEGNISAFYTLYVTRDFDDRQRTISHLENENNINSDDDIFNIINNNIFNDKKNIMSLVEQSRAEVVNENLLALNVSRKILGIQGGNFSYDKYYWLVVLYKLDDDNAIDSNGNVKKSYIGTSAYIEGSKKYYKIGFIMNVDSLGYLHSTIDNILYLNLDPFNINVKFNGINKPEEKQNINNEFQTPYENVLFNHFHESITNEGILIPSIYNVETVTTSAKENSAYADYFYTPGFCYCNISESCSNLCIKQENIGNYFIRSYDNNDEHEKNSSGKELYYDLVDSSVFQEEITFPSNAFKEFNHNNQVEFYIDLKRPENTEIEVVLNIKISSSFKVYWNFNEESGEGESKGFQLFEKTENDIIKHKYSNNESYSLIRIVSTSPIIYLGLGENNNKSNIKSLAIFADIESNDLSENNKNDTIRNLFLYKINPSFRIKLSDFKSLNKFEDKFNNGDNFYYAFSGVKKNYFFADSNANNLKNYKEISFKDIEDASKLMSGWNKNGEIILNIGEEATTFDYLINNAKNITGFKLNFDSPNKNDCSFISAFENDELLNSFELDGTDEIHVKDISGVFKDCINLTTVVCPFSFSSNALAKEAFKNTKALEEFTPSSTFYKIISMEGMFNGSGITSFSNIEDENNKSLCRNFKESFSNCKYLTDLKLDIYSATNINNIIYNSDNIMNLEIKNISIPLSFSSFINEQLFNNEYFYSIGLSPNVDLDDDCKIKLSWALSEDLDIDIVNNISSPQIRISDEYSNSVVSKIITTENLINSSIKFGIIDVSNCFDDIKNTVYNVVGENGHNGWFVYDNPYINNFSYINFIPQKGFRSSYNWNNIYLSKDNYNIINIEDSDSSGIIKYSGGKTGYEIKIENIAPEASNELTINSTISEDIFFDKIKELGAIDILFGASYSTEEEFSYINIKPNEIKDFSVIFIMNCIEIEDTIQDEEYSIQILMENDDNKKCSMDIEFIRRLNNKFNKIDILENEKYIYENYDTQIVSKNNNKAIVMFNLSSVSIDSEAIFKLSGKYILNGIIIANAQDVFNVLT